MRDHDEIFQVTQRLLETGYLLENENCSLLPLSIERPIGHNEAVDLLPLLKQIYALISKGRNERAKVLVSELAGLLMAAEMGIAREYLIEMEVKKAMPKVLKSLRKDLVENSTSTQESNIV